MPRAPVLDPSQYEPDEDGLTRAIVGPWVREKHVRLEKNVGISRAARKKYLGPGKAGATFIDVFCGPGRARIQETNDIVHGSPLVAWLESQRGKAPFSSVHVADANAELCHAAEARLRKAGAPVHAEIGAASETVGIIVGKLNPEGLHFAFLDPFNLEALPFDVIRTLASVKRMDLLVHVSLQDLNRNLRKYVTQEESPLDAFAPKWRESVDINRSDRLVRAKIWEHWRGLVKNLGMRTTETAEQVVGSRNQPLYLLAFAARHELPLEFWEKIRHLEPPRQTSLL